MSDMGAHVRSSTISGELLTRPTCHAGPNTFALSWIMVPQITQTGSRSRRPTGVPRTSWGQWRRHGGGGGRGNSSPPPQPPIGHPVKSLQLQIRGYFRVRKNGDRFTGFATTFYMQRCYDGRSLVLRLRKKNKLWKLLNELHW